MSEAGGARGIAVAIVGIGCRFPGGVTDAASFWQLLTEGRDAIGEIPSDRINIERYFDSRAATPGRMMTRSGGFLERIEEFDADFFEMSPREAERLDPQQRLLLETAWEALEDAGQDTTKLEGTPTGVFIGQWISDFEGRLFTDPEEVDFYMAQGSGRYSSSGRISYALGLRGPSLTLDTACSSSLVAVHLAIQSIRSGECKLALVGGANIILQPHISIAYSQSRMMAPDGRCKFGDAAGDGYVRSEGVAVVVLKPLDLATADGDRIYAVIRGSAINNDGRSSGSMGTPSRTGQEELLRSAYRDAGLAARRAKYFEAHGTGTRAGDPVELNALAAVLGEDRAAGSRTYVGSVKTNIGHTEAAAGLAGLIKVSLALHHQVIPPSLHCYKPNPAIPWDKLIIPDKCVSWPTSDVPRIGGVSAFGIAGSNAHVVLEEAPARIAAAEGLRGRSVGILALSARSPEALRTLSACYAETLKPDSAPAIYDVCWNAATRRTPLAHRAVFVGGDCVTMARSLRDYADGAATAAQGVVNGEANPKIAFICPGQGAQWVGMARQLLEREPAFREALERCDQAARPFVDWSIIQQISTVQDSSAYRLDQIDVVQPVLVAMAIAYAAFWRSLGIAPAAIVGHSMGEVAAACIAGALSLDKAMQIICRRSALMRRVSGQGAMALVDLSMQAACARLAGREDRLSVAVSNSPRSSVISGDPTALKLLMTELERDDVFCRLVKVDVASHSPQMDPLAKELSSDLAGLAVGEALIPIWSTVLGRRAQGHEFNAAYWGRNLRETVRFTDAVRQMLEDGVTIFVELGPHPILLQSIQQTAQSHDREVTTVACGIRDESDEVVVLTALGQLWSAGYPVNWDRVMPERGKIVPLPLYPWQRQRYWVDAAEMDAPAAITDKRIRPDDETLGWLHHLKWEPCDVTNAQKRAKTSWLIVSSDRRLSTAICESLASSEAHVSATSVADMEGAIAEFSNVPGPPHGIIVIVSDTPDAPYLPVRVLQSVLKNGKDWHPRLWMVTHGGQSVDGYKTRVSVDQGAIWGAARVIAEEHPNLWGGLVDLDPSVPPASDVDHLVRHILSGDGEVHVALRDGRRFVLRLVAGYGGARPKTFRWRPDSTYLITGGFGDIGLQIARMLVARGARRLILMGQTPLPPREEWGRIESNSIIGRRIAAVRALESEGVAVHIAAIDVGDQVQIEKYLKRYTLEGWPPIRGVFHAAGTLNDQLASSLSKADFEAVLGPKLRGAQHLDRLLPDLDLFVMVSSISAVIAQPGQANYAAANAGLDALARDRSHRGLPSLSVGWGVWADTGLVKGEIGERKVAELARQGIGRLPAERATSIFAWLCGYQEPYVAVIPIDWAKFQRARGTRNSPMFSEVLKGSEDSHGQVSKFKEQFATSTSTERRKLLDGVVKSAVGKVLKIAPSRIDPRKPIGSMGLTSLMAMELRNRLEAELERPLSATLVWNYPTVEALVAHLLDSGPGPVADLEAAERDLPRPDSIRAVIDLSDEQVLAVLRAGENAGGIGQ